MKIIVDIWFYSSEAIFFVNETPKSSIKLIKPKNRTPNVVNMLKTQNPENWLVCREWDDKRRQFCYLWKINLDHPMTYNRIAHEIYHIANNICQMIWLRDDWEWNEHIAYLIWYITEIFYWKLFWYKKFELDI